MGVTFQKIFNQPSRRCENFCRGDSVDKNLFLYDLAIVAILKNEGRYLKEWLDYHLIAGVDHFFLCDNDSTDDYEKIIAPYVKAGLVTSSRLSGKSPQFAAYDFAVRDYKFFCRYMAFVDLDEFIFPRNGQSISATVDEILLTKNNAAGLAVNWQLFGSNGEETADFSRGVLERFTRRAPVDWVVPIPNRDIPGGNAQVKTIADPRKINFFTSAHFPIYYEGFTAINENGAEVPSYCNDPVTAEKIAINHYNAKSREEFLGKINKGRAGKASKYLTLDWFDMYDRNEVFDDEILKYRATRAENFSLESDEEKFQRVTDALTKNLSDFALRKISDMETALTCRAVSSYLREKFPNDERLKVYEDASVAAVLNSLGGMKFSDVRLLLSALPEISSLDYPAVDELRNTIRLQIIPQMMNFMRENEFWREFSELDYLRRLLSVPH